MADFLDYDTTQQDLSEEEKRRRRQDPTFGEAISDGWDKLKSRYTDSSGDFSLGKTIASGLVNNANQPTDMEKQLMSGFGAPQSAGFITGGAGGMPPAIPVQPQAPVTMATAGGTPQPQPQPVQPAPIQQQANDEEILAAIRQKESSGNYNVGQHPGSSAWGAYGITDQAYQDVQNNDPYFANRPKTALTPEEQDRAARVIRQQNDKYLTAQGVEPTEPNRQLAHFLGAGGAAQYLRDGTISQAAADANGGPIRANQIAQERLALGSQLAGGGQAPRVAAVGYGMGQDEPAYGGAETQPTEQANFIQGNSIGILADPHANIEQLASVVSDPNADKLVKRVALDRMNTLANAPKNIKEAEAAINGAAQQDPAATRKVSNDLKPPKDGKNEGSWIRALLLAKLGLGEAAMREFALLGVGSTEHNINLDGQRGMVTMDAKGNIVKGYVEDKDGEVKDMSAEQLAKANQVAMSGKNIHQSPTERVDPQTGRKFILQTSSGGAPIYKPVDGGEPPTVEEQKRLEILGVGGTRTQQQSDKLQNLRNQVFYQMQTKGYQASLNMLEDQYKKGIISRDDLQAGTLQAAELAKQYNIPTGANTGGNAPAVAPAVNAPAVAPAVNAPAVSAVTPTTSGAVTPTPLGTTSPPGSPRLPDAQLTQGQILLKQSKEEQEKREQALKLDTEAQTLLLKNQDEFGKEVSAGRKTALASSGVTDRLMSAIDKNPELWGKLSGSPSWQAYINSTPENQQAAKTKLFNDINIPKEKRAIADQILNDYKTAEVAAVTGSGLSASQTNSEKEGARLVGTIGSIENKAEAAKATLTWVKANHDYRVAKANAWDEAVKKDKTITRNAFEAQFDAPGGAGDKIFSDANKKMEAIIYPKKKEEVTPSEFKVLRGNSGFTLKGVQ